MKAEGGRAEAMEAEGGRAEAMDQEEGEASRIRPVPEDCAKTIRFKRLWQAILTEHQATLPTRINEYKNAKVCIKFKFLFLKSIECRHLKRAFPLIWARKNWENTRKNWKLTWTARGTRLNSPP